MRHRQPAYRDPQPMVPRALAEKILRQRDAVAEQLSNTKAEATQFAHRSRELAAELEASRVRVRQLEAALVQLERPKDGADQRVERLTADIANLRRRQSETIDARVHQATRETLQELLTVRDSLSQALDGAPDSAWHRGTAQILHQFDQVIERQGLHRLGAVGEPFDPAQHEALGTTETGRAGTVAHVVRHGFAFGNGDLVRPAQVIVSNPG
ncbi:MAG: nucleotide exchange factor GrpE [Proteobacteria bacterium]|nr:nucleotide exchange factor GrpE [Pseudomonadota bacterium]